MRSNPFATRYTRPGALAFLFPPGQSPETIVAALRQAGWWGEIVGPHGSGKSTLLAALIPELEKQGRQVVQVVLGEGQRMLSAASGQKAAGRPSPIPDWPLAPESWTDRSQVVIDGYEQLSWWNRRKVEALVRRAGSGLLVTTHQTRGLPTLFQSEPSLQLAQSIVRQLQPPEDSTITPEDVAQAWEEQGNNVREVLFRLYDLYQSRQK